MATFTPNYNLRKPDSADLVDEDADLNDNYDIIDAEIKDRADEIDQLELDARGVRQVVVITATGTFDKATYPWLKGIRVRGVASGGAGGGAAATGASQSSGGGGGAAGAWGVTSIIPVASLAASETVTIGAAGVGASGALGGAGAACSFGAHLTLPGGGGGGFGGASGSIIFVGGGTTAAPGGTALSYGAPGNPGFGALTSGSAGSAFLSAQGAASHFGPGGAQTVNANGNAPTGGYGGGGSGCSNGQSQAVRTGGNGLTGVFIVELLG